MFCLTLLNADKKEIWAMNPDEIADMSSENAGSDYQTTTFRITNNGKTVGYVMIGQYTPLLLSEQDINFIKSINWNIAISVIITIILSALISMYFTRQFSNPIKEVSETSVELSEGKYKAKAKAKSSVLEISNLIKSINILGDRLKSQDDLRKRLVSDISHEIRTPLNIFQNNLEAMIDGVFPATTERLIYLNDEVIRFGKLLNNLDILKEFEEEKVNLHFEKFNLDELIINVVDSYSIHLNSNHKQLLLNIQSNGKYLTYGDKDKIRQVFINVLSNAVKFTDNNGRITIKIYNEKDNIVVIIQDNGIGIKKSDLPYIFERLYRGDKSRHEIEGSGIGLTITRQIMSLHSGTVDVDSEENVGTTVTLRFNQSRK
jgi:signal transduction histidine kinase